MSAASREGSGSRRRVPLMGRASTAAVDAAQQAFGRTRGDLDVAIVHEGREGCRVPQAQHAVEGERVEARWNGGRKHLGDVGLEDVACQDVLDGAGDGRLIGLAREVRLPAGDEMRAEVARLALQQGFETVGLCRVSGDDPGAFLHVVEGGHVS